MTLAPKILAPILVVAILAVGLWFWGGVVAPGYWSTILLCTAWFFVASMIFGRVTKSRPELRWPVRGTFLACVAIAIVGFYWTSIRDTVVDEDIVTGVPASRLAEQQGSGGIDPLAPRSSGGAQDDGEPERRAPAANVVERQGSVEPDGHSASGTARVVKLAAGGRKLTLGDGFEIDPGPQVRVYLTAGGSTEDFKDLGALKGSKGDQQYSIPGGTDLARYDTVVFWCVPFSQSLAKAALRAA